MGGGLVVIADRGVQAELPLPVAGLLSDAPLPEVVEASRACVEAAEALGCIFPAPFQTLAFLALSVIPKLKITDRGLIDVDEFAVVSLEGS
jgi:adenine deaminase